MNYQPTALDREAAERQAQKEIKEMEVLPTLTNGARVIIFACERAIKQDLVQGAAKKNVAALKLYLENWLCGRNTLNELQKKQFKEWQDSSNAMVQSILQLAFQIQPMLKDYFFDRLDNVSFQMTMNGYLCNADALKVALETLDFEIQDHSSSYKATYKKLTIDVTSGNLAFVSCAGYESRIQLWEWTVGEVCQILEPLISKQNR